MAVTMDGTRYSILDRHIGIGGLGFSRMLRFVFIVFFFRPVGGALGNCKVGQWIDQGQPGAVSLLLSIVLLSISFF